MLLGYLDEYIRQERVSNNKLEAIIKKRSMPVSSAIRSMLSETVGTYLLILFQIENSLCCYHILKMSVL